MLSKSYQHVPPQPACWVISLASKLKFFWLLFKVNFEEENKDEPQSSEESERPMEAPRDDTSAAKGAIESSLALKEWRRGRESRRRGRRRRRRGKVLWEKAFKKWIHEIGKKDWKERRQNRVLWGREWQIYTLPCRILAKYKGHVQWVMQLPALTTGRSTTT